MPRQMGKVKSFDEARGFGFIAYAEGPDLFVHYSAIQSKTDRTLKSGDYVEFDVVEGVKRSQADNVKRIEAADRLTWRRKGPF